MVLSGWLPRKARGGGMSILVLIITVSERAERPIADNGDCRYGGEEEHLESISRGSLSMRGLGKEDIQSLSS